MLRRGWRSSNRDRRTTPSADKRWLGDKAEAAARSELRRRGYHIIAHNFRTRVGEIDIVARKGESLVFVEVRSRTTHEFGAPRESITAGKQRRLSKAAAAYLRSRRLSDVSWRFDVAEVYMTSAGRVESVAIIENAFPPRGLF